MAVCNPLAHTACLSSKCMQLLFGMPCIRGVSRYGKHLNETYMYLLHVSLRKEALTLFPNP